MNLLETEVARTDGGFRLSVGTDMAFQVPGDTLDAAARKALEQAPRVRVGIRPQKIAVGTGDVHLRVVSNQWLGDQSHVAAECAGNLLIAVTASRIAARRKTASRSRSSRVICISLVPTASASVTRRCRDDAHPAGP